MNKECSSYIRGSFHCRDGHYQTAVCVGIFADTCVPTCCNEKLCGRLYDNFGGKPFDGFVLNREQLDG